MFAVEAYAKRLILFGFYVKNTLQPKGKTPPLKGVLKNSTPTLKGVFLRFLILVFDSFFQTLKTLLITAAIRTRFSSDRFDPDGRQSPFSNNWSLTAPP